MLKPSEQQFQGRSLLTSQMADTYTQLIGYLQLRAPLHVAVQEDLIGAPSLRVNRHTFVRFQSANGFCYRSAQSRGGVSGLRGPQQLDERALLEIGGAVKVSEGVTKLGKQAGVGGHVPSVA